MRYWTLHRQSLDKMVWISEMETWVRFFCSRLSHSFPYHNLSQLTFETCTSQVIVMTTVAELFSMKTNEASFWYVAWCSVLKQVWVIEKGLKGRIEKAPYIKNKERERDTHTKRTHSHTIAQTLTLRIIPESSRYYASDRITSPIG